jgi:hypothetical protein
MSGKGNCSDNSMVETFFKTLKPELVWRTMFETRQQAEQAIGRTIDGFSNPVRRHSALNFTSPAQFEKRATNWSNVSPLNRTKSSRRLSSPDGERLRYRPDPGRGRRRVPDLTGRRRRRLAPRFVRD